MRACEICGCSEQEPIHRQYFLFPGQMAPIHYDVVACRHCGFTFASDIPDQSSLNRFYQDSEHHLHYDLPLGLSRIHDNFFRFLQQNLNLSSATRVLDIGSGMGHFLSRFKREGLHNLIGLEPSQMAKRLGDEVYALEIQTETVDTFTPTSTFSLVTLCGVLEHISDLKTSVCQINRLLEKNGHLFIAVPDAASFGKAPPTEAFLEFALEHINFFSATSLDNLLRQAGFEAVRVESQHNDFYDNSYLLALYRKTADFTASAAIYPDNSSSCLKAYVELSRQRQLPITSIAAQLATDGEPLIVWGAGSLTSRLLCDTRLGEANIVGIIDRNKALHGRELLGIPIAGPEIMLKAHPNTTVFIASTTYAMEITARLNGEYDWKGKIITLIRNAC